MRQLYLRVLPYFEIQGGPSPRVWTGLLVLYRSLAVAFPPYVQYTAVDSDQGPWQLPANDSQPYRVSVNLLLCVESTQELLYLSYEKTGQHTIDWIVWHLAGNYFREWARCQLLKCQIPGHCTNGWPSTSHGKEGEDMGTFCYGSRPITGWGIERG